MAEGRLAKPQLRNLHYTYVKKHLVGLVACSLATVVAYKCLVADPHNAKIENFYKTYDPMKALDVMNKAGLMDSASDD